MALYVLRSIFHLARLLYVRPENFGPTLVNISVNNDSEKVKKNKTKLRQFIAICLQVRKKSS